MDIINVTSSFSLFLTLVYLIVVIAFIIGWHRLRTNKLKYLTPRTKVSVLVAARNEEHHIGLTIQDILNQDYESNLIELIIINDHSTDRTAEIVQSFQSNGVKLINLNENKALNSYKKKAIQTAIAQATGDLIVTTDADCRMGKNWIKAIVSYYEENDFKMISSPVAYFQERSIFEKFQTLEFSYLIGLGGATIGMNRPSTCNGANLAYERKAFDGVEGFKGIDDLASGDDELLLHKISAKYNHKVGFLKNRDAIVYTLPKSTIGQFFEQRKRWASKSTRYKNKSIVLLGVAVWLFNLSILLNSLIALVFPSINLWSMVGTQLLLKVSVEIVFLSGILRFFRREQLLVWQPLVSMLHILYIVYIGIAGNSGRYNWKGRMVK
ncbi:MAG: glycosyltransferase [Pedobacter sp.]|nr:MAG: glycosyltransferase [Pedobacter sp.]